MSEDTNPTYPPNDARGFTLYATVKDITLIPPNPKAPKDLQVDLFRIKCDNFEARVKEVGDYSFLYAHAGSLHFYTAPEQELKKAWRVGETLEITVKPWKGAFVPGKRIVTSIIQTAEEAKQSNQE